MKKICILSLSGFLYFASVSHAYSPGFQANYGLGIDYPDNTSKRQTAYLLDAQLSTYSQFFRVYGAFTLLYGSGYQAGEGALGFSIYPLSKYVSERAKVHPYLFAQGSVGISRVSDTNTRETGYGYGAGIDWRVWRKAGFFISAMKNEITNPSMRYTLGLFWFRPNE